MRTHTAGSRDLKTTIVLHRGTESNSEGSNLPGCVDRTEASILVTDNPGCILHLRGGVHASGREVRVLHLAEYLAGRLPDATTTNGT